MPWIHPRDINHRKIYADPFADKRWNDCFNSWLAWLKSQNEVADTARRYELRVRHFFELIKKRPDQCTRQDVERYLQEANVRTGAKCKPRTYNAKLASLKSFYFYASTFEFEFRGKPKLLMPGRPPTYGMKNIKASTRSRAMKDEEITRVFRAVENGPRNPRDKALHRALFLTYLWSGRRAAEITRLRWRDIDLVKIYDEQLGQTRDAWIYHWRGKGHVEVDDCMEMPPDAVAAIIDYLEIDGRWEKMQADSPIFAGKWAGTTIHPGSVATIFRRYCLAAGISESGLHRFRHTAAMARWDETKNITYVSKFLRHKDLSTTRVYVDPEIGQADLVAAKLRGRFGHL